MRSSSRGHVLPAALIFVAMTITVAGGAYLWQTRQNPPATATANWKTYTSSRLKFMIKYPNDWFFDEETLTSFDKERAKRGGMPKEPFQTCHFVPYDPPVFNILAEIVIQDGQPQITKQRIIDSSIQPQSDKNASTAYVIKQSGYSSVGVVCIDQREIYEPKVNQVLSTFRFLDQNP